MTNIVPEFGVYEPLSEILLCMMSRFGSAYLPNFGTQAMDAQDRLNRGFLQVCPTPCARTMQATSNLRIWLESGYYGFVCHKYTAGQ